MILAARSIILHLLATEGPAHGRLLRDRAAARGGGVLRLWDGCLYRAIDELEAEGALRIQEDAPPEHGGRPRRVAHITNQGRAEAARVRTHLLSFLQGDIHPFEAP